MLVEFLEVADRRIAVSRQGGLAPTVVWLGGFRSDMTATKATHLAGWAQKRGRGFVRFDYSGHGQSSGRFEDGTVSRWLEDTLAVFATVEGPLLLVGSSMGGHLALLALRRLHEIGAGSRCVGLVLVAPAPDFAERLMWRQFPEAVRHEIVTRGRWDRPSAYAPKPTPITRALIEDGRRHVVLEAPIALGAPVHILHGTADPDVPWSLSVELMGRIVGTHVTLTLVAGGDHRLSTPMDLALLERIVEGIA